jgi:ABC-type antimicrobial peptide transport system permease subunit
VAGTVFGMPIFRISTMATFFRDRAMLGTEADRPDRDSHRSDGTFHGGDRAIRSRRLRREPADTRNWNPPCDRRDARLYYAHGAEPRRRFHRGWLAIGLALVIPIARNVVPNFVVGTNPLGAIVLFGVPALLPVATMVACWIPAQRAAKVDPTRALRQE